MEALARNGLIGYVGVDGTWGEICPKLTKTAARVTLLWQKFFIY